MINKVKKIGAGIVFGAGMLFMSPYQAEPQIPDGINPDTSLESVVQESYQTNQNNYNVYSHFVSGQETIEDIARQLNTVNHRKLGWLLDAYSNPLGRGEQIFVAESEYETKNSSGEDVSITFPRYVLRDSGDEERLLIADVENITENRPAFIVDYHDQEGYLWATMWINKTNPEIFTCRVRQDFISPLEGDISDYRITSDIGPRGNPTPESGGPDRDSHRGVDFGVPTGTPIYNMIDGELNIDYILRPIAEMQRAQEAGNPYEDDLYLGKTAFIRKTIAIPDNHGNITYISLISQNFHLDDYPDGIKERIIEEQMRIRDIPEERYEEYLNWYTDLLNNEEEYIINDLHRQSEGINSMNLRAWIPVEQGEIIGYTGDTGRGNGEHLHAGLRVENNIENIANHYGLTIYYDNYLDIIEIFEKVAPVSVYSPSEMQEEVSEFRRLYNSER
ncbi:MAG: hypothetical protein ACLFPQ_02975 [Candidatus Woesearchaeota archaeon]